MNRLTIAATLAALATAPLFGAATAQESIVVTASRIDADNGSFAAAPAIYRRIPADFVQVEVTFQSGTRDLGERRNELEKSFDRLLDAAAKTEGFELSGGDIGESTAPIDSVLFTDVYTNYGNQGQFTLILNVDTRPNESFDALMKRAQAFVTSVKPQGRAESFLGSDQYLGARNMGDHRQALLKDISAEIANLMGPLGASGVTATGLQSRVVTRPSGPLELEIYIPYSLTVEWED